MHKEGGMTLGMLTFLGMLTLGMLGDADLGDADLGTVISTRRFNVCMNTHIDLMSVLTRI